MSNSYIYKITKNCNDYINPIFNISAFLVITYASNDKS